MSPLQEEATQGVGQESNPLQRSAQFDEPLPCTEQTTTASVSKLGKEGRIDWIDEHDEIKCFPCNSANWRDDLADLGDGLFLGGRSLALCPYNLQRLGLTHVFQVMDYYGRPGQFKGFQYFVVHVKDWSSEAEKLAAKWDEAFEFIEQAKKENGKVLVHCFAGKFVACSGHSC